MDKTENIKQTEAEEVHEEITEEASEEVKEEAAEIPETVSKSKRKRRRIKLYEITAENDIRYRGPLSYRHLRIFAWVFLAMAQVGLFLSVASKVDPVWGAEISWITEAMSFFGNLSLPLFLLAAFSVILNVKDGYRKIIILYSACCVGIIIGYIFVYNHYFIGLVNAAMKDRTEAKNMVDMIIVLVSSNGFISLNVFVDLLLCTLFTYFINYHPTKFFQGKKIIIFRLFALLPVIYEILSIIIKILSASGEIILSVYVFPFLTTKPPAMFLMFIALAFFIKVRERKYRKHGKTLKEYKAFLKTNANSLHFSVYTCIIIVITIVIDLISLIFVTVLIFAANGGAELVANEEIVIQFFSALSSAIKLGFGGSFVLLFAIPFVLLFSYTKTYKDKLIDKAIPIGGIALILAVYGEGIFQLLCVLAGKL